MRRGVFARALPLALPFPYFLPSFIAADMPQPFCSRFAACRDFPLFPACFLSPPCAEVRSLAFCRLPCLSPIFCPLLLSQICRNVFARALLFVALFLRPFRFLSPLYAKVRLFALRFVPPLLVAFSRARKRAGAFCCPRTDGESLRDKKRPANRSGNYPRG